MDEAKAFDTSAVSANEFWNRLAPLLVLGFQVLALFLLIVAAVLAFSWFDQPALGFFVDPAMVIGNEQQPRYEWEKQTFLEQIPNQDVLLAIDAQEVQHVLDLQQVLSQYQVGDQVELLLQARSGHIMSQTVQLGNFSNYERMMYFFLPFVLAVGFLGAGFWAVRVRLDDPSARVFGILTASLALALACWFDLWSTQRLVIVWLFSMGISIGAFLHFWLLFPKPYRFYHRSPYIGWAGYLVGIGLAGYAVSTLQNYNFPTQFTESRQPLWILVVLCLLVFMIGLIVRRYSSISPVELEQSRIVLWGSGLALLPMTGYLLGKIFQLDSFTIPLVVALAPLVLLPLSITYAILRYRVVNTDLLISRTLYYAILSLLAGAGYAALISGLGVIFTDLVSVDSPFLIGIVVFVLALIINPFRNQVQLILDSIFFRGEGAYRQDMDSYAERISHLVELPAIAGLMREYVTQHLEPLRLHIYVYDALVDRYVPTLGEDGRPTTDIRFPRNSGLVHRLSSKRKTFFLDMQDTLPHQLQNERARLALLGAQLFIALPGQERLSGWLALGPRASGERYTGHDLDFLSNLADHAAKAIERAQVMADKDRRVHEMNVLTRVAQGINITINFDDILELLYAQSSQVIPLDDFNITLYNEATNLLRHVFLVQKDDRISELENESIPLGYGLEREVLQLRRPIITDDYQQECRNRRVIPNKKGIYAWMGVPLNAGAEVIGVIAVGSYNPAILYTEDQHNILQAIADQAAGAIVKARLLEETEIRARQLASLNEVTRGLTSTLELDPLLEDIMSSAVEILDCEAGSLLLVDPDLQELVYEVVIGPVADEFLGSRQPVGIGLAGKVAESMEPMIVNNVEQSPDWNSTPDQETGFVTRGMLVVPMLYKGSVIGVLEVINKKNKMPFTIDDQELLNAFAGQAAVAVENVRLYMQTDQELANRVEELSVMQRIDRELNTSLDIGKAMEITLEWAMRQSQSMSGLVGVLVEDGLQVMASQGYSYQLSKYETGVLPLDLPALASVLGEGRLYQPDTEELAQSSLLENAQSQLAVPIRREAEVIGLILLESLSGDHYNENTIDFITRLSDHASIAISNAQLYSEVQRANLAKSDFVSFVSHELKTPMTSIRGYADLLAAGSVGQVTEPQMEFLTTIRSNIQRMATLVSDLADISRIEAGRLHLEFSPVVLNEVVDEVVRSTLGLAKEKDHQVMADIPHDLPKVWGDRNRLVQILTNLLSNAIKYTPEGGEVTLRARLADNEWDPAGVPQVVHIQVIDNGIGIKLEDQAKIFQQYFRTDEGRDTASGTGLGLNISRYLVEIQGGKIWFVSEFGRGTTFHFTVPVAEEEGV
ncbi:MAG TPA: hypothetical protein DCY42_02130 [Chloroflexi bacterium]|nr:hypothetical protein [Chloroflexota bacterium]